MMIFKIVLHLPRRPFSPDWLSLLILTSVPGFRHGFDADRLATIGVQRGGAGVAGTVGSRSRRVLCRWRSL